MIARPLINPLSQLYALQAENSGLREALRYLRADVELARDLEAVRSAQREKDARMVDELFAAAQTGTQLKAGDLAALADRMRGQAYGW
jgi:hypothetical protein